MAKRRKRGDGSVHLRKDGRWEGRYVTGYNEKGLPQTKNVLAKTKSECIAKLKALKASTEKPKQTETRSSMLWGDWLDCWYQTFKKPSLRPNTQMSYEQRIYNHIIPKIGTVPLDKLTQKNMQQFYNQLKKNGRLKNAENYGQELSDQTVRGCHTTLHAALEAAATEHLIPPQSVRWMQTAFRQGARDESSLHRGNPAAADSGKRGRLL